MGRVGNPASQANVDLTACFNVEPLMRFCCNVTSYTDGSIMAIGYTEAGKGTIVI